MDEKYQKLAALKRTLQQSRWDALVSECRQDEAIATTLFEQVPIKDKETGLAILSGKTTDIADDAQQELKNAVTAADYARTKNKLENTDIMHIQGLLMHGLNDLRPPSQYKLAGAWKKVRNTIGGRECPSPEETPKLMEDFSRWLNGDAKSLNPVVAAWTAQFIFTYIHPFDDGNGRTSRIIAQHVLDHEQDSNYSGLGVVSLSDASNDSRTQILRAMDNITSSNNRYDITQFVNFMAYVQGIAVDNAINKIEQMPIRGRLIS